MKDCSDSAEAAGAAVGGSIKRLPHPNNLMQISLCT